MKDFNGKVAVVIGGGGGSRIHARAHSAANRTPPEYLRQPVTFAPRS